MVDSSLNISKTKFDSGHFDVRLNSANRIKACLLTKVICLIETTGGGKSGLSLPYTQ